MREKIFAEKEFSKEGSGILTEKERHIIHDTASMRKRSIDFRISAQRLGKIEEVSNDVIKEVRKKELDNLFKEAAYEIKLSSNPDFSKAEARVLDLTARAKSLEDQAPNLAALCYANAAKTRLESGKDFQDLLELARKYIKKSADMPNASPNSILPQAIVLGIEKAIVKGQVLPSSERVASAVLNDKELIKEYALALPEGDRESFLNALPTDKRREAAILMDRELSNFLKQQLIAGEEEQKQRGSVRSRAVGFIEQAIGEHENLNKSDIKILVETLEALDDDESKRALLELGKKALTVGGREDSDFRTRYAARILKTLAEIDISKAGNLAMKFLAKKELRMRLFPFFSRLLINKKYLTRKAEPYLADPKNWPFLKRLIAEYPNQFNTVVDTISQIKDYKPQIHEDEIFAAIKELDSLTPIIFNRYRLADANGKKELTRTLKELKPKFFQNVPIKEILPQKDREILGEMVYLSYKPIGMDFQSVNFLISRLSDQTGDLKKYSFPLEGYDFSLGSEQVLIFKEGEGFEPRKVETYKNLFSLKYPDEEKSVKSFSVLLTRLAKAGSNLKTEEISELLSIMSRDEAIKEFLNRHKSIDYRDPKSINTFLNGLKELLGIYFDDNYVGRLENFLEANPTTAFELSKALSKPERIKVLKSQLGSLGGVIDWSRLGNNKEMAKLLASFLGYKVLKSLKDEISSSFKKIVTQKGEVSGRKSVLKLYISKNIGSFFAKASAGICTAGDIPLFERDDHFHMNVVEDDAFVRANIQAYIIKDGKQQSLVLRGFNPNTDFMDKIDIAEFCEKIIATAKKFKEDNKLHKLYITEQGSWHALSNRNSVGTYLIKKYLKDAKVKNYKLEVSSSHSVNTIYEL